MSGTSRSNHYMTMISGFGIGKSAKCDVFTFTDIERGVRGVKRPV